MQASLIKVDLVIKQDYKNTPDKVDLSKNFLCNVYDWRKGIHIDLV